MVVLFRTGDVSEGEHVESRISNTASGRDGHEDRPGNEPEGYEYLEHKTDKANEEVGIGAVDVQDGNFGFTPYEGKPADYMCG